MWSQRICPKARYSLKDPRAFAQFLRDSDVRLVRAKFGPQSLQLYRFGCESARSLNPYRLCSQSRTNKSYKLIYTQRIALCLPRLLASENSSPKGTEPVIFQMKMASHSDNYDAEQLSTRATHASFDPPKGQKV